jgi:hypothetical protein
MAILRTNTIKGQKPEFGNRDHINYCQQLEGIRNGTRPIISDNDFEGVCRAGNSYYKCTKFCTCNKIKATFHCINCNKKHTVISGYAMINSPIVCSCGFTYSEKYDGQINDWFLIGDGSEDTIY